MTTEEARRIVAWLNAHATEADGRPYAKALIKFEPSDVGEIRVPVDLVPAGFRREALPDEGPFRRDRPQEPSS